MTLRKSTALVVALVLLAGAGCARDDEGGQQPTDAAKVATGRTVYEATCAACHGEDLKGTRIGPPFLNIIYAPNHHPDDSFRAAVARGVRPHHWDFGAMPPQPQVSEEEIDAVIAYVRSRQRAAGITEDPSH